MINEVYRGEARLDNINYSMITLIPKKDQAETIGDFRPIALLNYSIKIITKLLSNRLAPKLQSMIVDYQTSFISGRKILEGAASAYEIIHQCKKTKSNGYILKLGFEKAYDMIECDCFVEFLHL